MAAALANAWMRGSSTVCSASGTDAFTPSSPPKLEFVVTRGLSGKGQRGGAPPAGTPNPPASASTALAAAAAWASKPGW
eukprot:3942288-Pleurochrysis_carterae.AAC.2